MIGYLRWVINRLVPDLWQVSLLSLGDASRVDIKLLDKEQFFYWRICNAVAGEIPRTSPLARFPSTGERLGEVESCPCCGASMGI